MMCDEMRIRHVLLCHHVETFLSNHAISGLHHNYLTMAASDLQELILPAASGLKRREGFSTLFLLVCGLIPFLC